MAAKPSSGLQLSFAPEYDRQLPMLFHGPALIELANTGASKLAKYLIQRSEQYIIKNTVTYADFFEACHRRMWENYRAEYVYKNAIARKILLGCHSLQTTKFLTEFRVEQCKADVVLINGTSTVYEIKTELDSLDRLQSQLLSYCRVFDHVYVATHDSFAKKLEEVVDDRVGIIVLSDNYSFRKIKKAVSNKHAVVQTAIFDSLRREEYMRILRDAKFEIPNVPNTQIYSVCKKLFSQLDPITAHDGMVKVLHEREPSEALKALVENGPDSLKAVLLSTGLSDKQVNNLSDYLYTASL